MIGEGTPIIGNTASRVRTQSATTSAGVDCGSSVVRVRSRPLAGSQRCLPNLQASPEQKALRARRESDGARKMSVRGCAMTKDPVCGMKIDENTAKAQTQYHGQKYSSVRRSASRSLSGIPNHTGRRRRRRVQLSRGRGRAAALPKARPSLARGPWHFFVERSRETLRRFAQDVIRTQAILDARERAGRTNASVPPARPV